VVLLRKNCQRAFNEQFSVPDEFLCPISREVMDDPVLASDGFTFERNAIERFVCP
jgi:hypothetical protein